jgi:uroporphyrin-III C-methyltransferase
MTGMAYLVGAGPGRADLITVRGLNLLRQAEVVLYDRLIPQELLQEAPATAELIFVGKGPDRHMLPQEEINALLIERVRAGKRVVRLKGGDPFVFGRGGEEVLALAEAGLRFEIVPGVSSALAGPAYAGIPVTQRGVVTAFAVVTGHEDPTKPESATDWAALAQVPTLILMMAIKNIEQICGDLIAAGRDPATPTAAISWATTDKQRVLRATLQSLPEQVTRQKLPTPAVIVIGEVAALHDQLAWFQPEGASLGFVPLQPEATRPGDPQQGIKV